MQDGKGAPEELEDAIRSGSFTGADLVAFSLSKTGINMCFGIPGVQNLALYAGLARAGVDNVLIANEQSAANIAAGLWEVGGQLACVNIIGGPGITHALGGIARATRDRVPMLVLTTGIKTGPAYAQRHFQLHNVDNKNLLSPVCKNVASPERAADLPQCIFKAVMLSLQEPRGPVAVDVPSDMLSSPVVAKSLRSITGLPSAEEFRELQNLYERTAPDVSVPLQHATISLSPPLGAENFDANYSSKGGFVLGRATLMKVIELAEHAQTEEVVFCAEAGICSRLVKEVLASVGKERGGRPRMRLVCPEGERCVLGYAIPAAIGAALSSHRDRCRPNSVFAVVNPQSLLMTCLEMVTAVKNSLYITIIIVDGEKGNLDADHIDPFVCGAATKGLDVQEIAKVFGFSFMDWTTTANGDKTGNSLHALAACLRGERDPSCPTCTLIDSRSDISTQSHAPDVNTQHVESPLSAKLSRGIPPLFKALAAAGVGLVVGSPPMSALGSLLEQNHGAIHDGLRIVHAVDDQSTGFIADGYCRSASSGKRIAAAVVDGSPGAMSAIFSGVGEAFLDSAPMIVLIMTACCNSATVRVAAEVCKSMTRVVCAEDVEQALKDAARSCVDGVPAPVAVVVNPAILELPDGSTDDMFRDPNGTGVNRTSLPPPTVSLPSAVSVDATLGETASKIAAALLAATQPRLHLGLGAATTEAASLAKDIAERCGCVVSTTFSGKGSFPENHPQWLWPGVGPALPPALRQVGDNCDVWLIVGAQMGELSSAHYRWRSPQNVYHVDADPRVPAANVSGATGIVADATVFLRELAVAVDRAAPEPTSMTVRRSEALKKRISDAHASHAEVVYGESKRVRAVGRWLSTADIFATLQQGMPLETTYITDSGNGTVMAAENLRLVAPRRVISPCNYSSMGYSVPAAIGAALGGMRVPRSTADTENNQDMGTAGNSAGIAISVAVAGDGAFLMTGTELATAVQLCLPLVVVVLSDGELGMMSGLQRNAGADPFCTELSGYDPTAVARAVGCASRLVNNIDDLVDAVAWARSRCERGVGPALLDVKVSYAFPSFYSRGIVGARPPAMAADLVPPPQFRSRMVVTSNNDPTVVSKLIGDGGKSKSGSHDGSRRHDRQFIPDDASTHDLWEILREAGSGPGKDCMAIFPMEGRSSESFYAHRQGRTYREVLERSTCLARFLMRHEHVPLRIGEVVGLLTQNLPEAMEVHYAVGGAARGVTLNLNYRLAPAEMAYILIDAAPRWIVVTATFFGRLVEALSEVPETDATVCGILVINDSDRHAQPDGLADLGTSGIQIVRYETAANWSNKKNEHDSFEAARLAPGAIVGDLPCEMYYTSGTTGRPKGVQLTHTMVILHAAGCVREHGHHKGDVWGHFAPMFHLVDAYGMFSITMVHGRHVFILGYPFRASDVLDSIESCGVTVSNVASTMIVLLLNDPSVTSGSRNFSSLQLLSCGGAPLSRDCTLLAMRTFGCEFFLSYGMTECCGKISMSILDDPVVRHLPPQRQLDLVCSSGRPFGEISLRLRSDCGDLITEMGKMGEVEIKGRTVFKGYHGQPASTAEAFTEDGWFKTGDLAYFVDHGFIVIGDRKKDMILTGSENVYSVEVERVLCDHPDVKFACVFGIPNAVLGQIVFAVVVLIDSHKCRDRISDKVLQRHCAMHLADYKCPRSIAFVEESSIPLTGSGKVAKAQLRNAFVDAQRVKDGHNILEALEIEWIPHNFLPTSQKPSNGTTHTNFRLVIVGSGDHVVTRALAKRFVELGMTTDIIDERVESFAETLQSAQVTRLLSEMDGLVYLGGFCNGSETGSLNLEKGVVGDTCYGSAPHSHKSTEDVIRRVLDLTRSFLSASRGDVNENRTNKNKTSNLWIVTRGAPHVTSEGVNLTDICTGPLQQALWGFGRVAAAEAGESQQVHLIDMCPLEIDEQVLTTALASEIVGTLTSMDQSRSMEIVWRRRQRYMPSLRKSQLPTFPRVVRLRSDASYIVTGGLGGLGMKLAERMANSWGAGKVILVSRRSPSPETAEVIRDLQENTGCKIEFAQADVSREEDVADLFATLGEDDERPCRGIFHLAGVESDGLIVQHKNWESFRSVLDAKVAGSQLLDKYAGLCSLPLDYFVLFSSIYGLLGYRELSHYAAANAYQDGLAFARNARGLPATAVSWGTWSGAGMAHRFGKGFERYWKGQGMDFVPLDAGLDTLAIVLGSQRESVHHAVMPANWAKYGSVRAARGPHPLAAKLVADASLASTGDSTVNSLSPANIESNAHDTRTCDMDAPIASIVRSTEPERRVGAVERALCELIEDIIDDENVSSTIDVSLPVSEVGLSSMHVVDMMSRLQGMTGLELPPTLIYEVVSISALAVEIVKLINPPSRGVPLATAENAKSHSDHGSTIADIGIVGMACRLPGEANNIDRYWQNLLDEVDCVREPPTDRPNNGRQSGYLSSETIMKFDKDLFNISSAEAEVMDPQQRLLLHVALEAFEDAGIDVRALDDRSVGVFVGISAVDYATLSQDAINSGKVRVSPYSGTGWHLSIAANRISYCLDLHGPSVSIDTACSSSLVAIDAAVNALRSGQCNMAIVAAANLQLVDTWSSAFVCAGMLGRSARCRFGDDNADGYVRGEGVGAILLSKVGSESQQSSTYSGLSAYAHIATTAVNQDGKSNGLTAPNPAAQERLLRKCYEGLDISNLAYVEAHGTGTNLGDPIELKALSEALAQPNLRLERGPLLVGSVKASIGHLECAAGLASIIKAAKILSTGIIPRSLYYDTPNHHVSFDRLNLQVAARRTSLPRYEQDASGLLVGVSGFGFGGTNAHVVLEVAPQRCDIDRSCQLSQSDETCTSSPDRAWPLFVPVSSHSAAALHAACLHYASLLRSGEHDFADLCRSVTLRQRHCITTRPFRAAAVGHTPLALAEELEAIVQTSQPGRPRETKVGLVFTGQGSGFAGMCRVLYSTNVTFRRTISECDVVLQSESNNCLWVHGHLGLWMSDQGSIDQLDGMLDLPSFVQPFLVATGIALGRTLIAEAGILQSKLVVLGHSLGEIAAWCIAGQLSLETAMALACSRGHSMESGVKPGAGAMAALRSTASDINDIIETGIYPGIEIAALNSNQSSVVSGPRESVVRLVKSFKEQGGKATILPVSYAFHSRHVEASLEQLRDGISNLNYAPPLDNIDVSIVSTLTGSTVDGASSVDYWLRHARQPVQFESAVKTLILEHECNLIIEVGAQPNLCVHIDTVSRACVTDNLNGSRRVTTVPTLRKGVPDNIALGRTLASMYVEGHSFSFEEIKQRTDRSFIRIPPVPVAGAQHWIVDSSLQTRSDSTRGCLNSVSEESTRLAEYDDLPITYPDWVNLDKDVVMDAKAIRAESSHDGPGKACMLDFTDRALPKPVEAILQDSMRGYLTIHSCSSVTDALACLQNGDAMSHSAWELVVVYGSSLGQLQAILKTIQKERIGFKELQILRLGQEDCTHTCNLDEHQRKGRSLDLAELDSAALLGFAKSARLEFPSSSTVRCVDIMDNSHTTMEAFSRLLQTRQGWRAAHGYNLRIQEGSMFVEQISLLPGLRHPRGSSTGYIRAAATSSQNILDGPFVITGGTGALGLQIAAWLIERGASDVRLFSRSGKVSEENLTLLDALEKVGSGKFTVLVCDVSDPDQLRSILSAMGPSLTQATIMHCAGVLDDGLLKNQTLERLESVMLPKAHAATNLHNMLEELDVDPRLLLLFSSVTALAGNVGQTSYGAANAVLDEVARRRRQMGRPTIAIQWGPWSDHGMAAKLTGPSLWRSISAPEALESLGWVMENADCLPAVVTVAKFNPQNSKLLVSRKPQWRFLFSSVLDDMPCSNDSQVQIEESSCLRDTGRGQGRIEAKHVASIIMDLIRANTSASTENITFSASLSELGFDSLDLTSLAEGIAARLRVSMDSADIVAVGTVNELIDLCCGRLSNLSLDHSKSTDRRAARVLTEPDVEINRHCPERGSGPRRLISIKDVLSSFLKHGISADEIEMESSLESLGLDSMDVMALATKIHSQVGIQLDPVDIMECERVADVQRLCEQHLQCTGLIEEPSQLSSITADGCDRLEALDSLAPHDALLSDDILKLQEEKRALVDATKVATRGLVADRYMNALTIKRQAFVVLVRTLFQIIGLSACLAPSFALFRPLRHLETIFASFDSASLATMNLASIFREVFVLLASMVPIIAVSSVIWSIVVKWGVVGRYRSNGYEAWSRTGVCQLIAQDAFSIADGLVDGFISETALRVWWYRAMGADIGSNVLIASKVTSDFDLIHIGDDVVVERNVRLLPTLSDDGMVHRSSPIVIGAGSLLCHGTVVRPGSRIGRDVRACVRSVVQGKVPCRRFVHDTNVYEELPSGIDVVSTVLRTNSGQTVGLLTLQIIAMVVLLTAASLSATISFLWLLASLSDTRIFDVNSSLGSIRLTFSAVFGIVTTPLIAWTTFAVQAVALKWILVGKVRPGIVELTTSRVARFWLVDRATSMIQDSCINCVFQYTTFMWLWYRALGCDIDFAAIPSAFRIWIPDLVQIESDAYIGINPQVPCAHVHVCSNKHSEVHFKTTKLGRRCFVGPDVIMLPGTTVEPEACVSAYAVTQPDTLVKRGRTAIGFMGKLSYKPNFECAPPQSNIRFHVLNTLFGLYRYGLTLMFTCIGWIAAFYFAWLFYGKRFMDGRFWRGDDAAFPLASGLACGLALPDLIVAPLFALVSVGHKWLLLGKIRDDVVYAHRSTMHALWIAAFAFGVHASNMLVLYRRTKFLNFLMRLRGAGVGHHTRFESLVMSPEADLLEIGDSVHIGSAPGIYNHDFSRGVMVFKRVKIGSATHISQNVMLLPGVSIGHGCDIGPNTMVMASAYKPCTQMRGNPASHVVRLAPEHHSNWVSEPRGLESLPMATEWGQLLSSGELEVLRRASRTSRMINIVTPANAGNHAARASRYDKYTRAASAKIMCLWWALLGVLLVEMVVGLIFAMQGHLSIVVLAVDYDHLTMTYNLGDSALDTVLLIAIRLVVVALTVSAVYANLSHRENILDMVRGFRALYLTIAILSTIALVVKSVDRVHNNVRPAELASLPVVNGTSAGQFVATNSDVMPRVRNGEGVTSQGPELSSERSVNLLKSTGRPFQLGVQAWSWWLDDAARPGKLLENLVPGVTWVRWSPVQYVCSNFTSNPRCSVTNPKLRECYTCNGEAPIGASDDIMDAFVYDKVFAGGQDGLSKVIKTHSDLERLGITSLLVFWSAPLDYLDAEMSATYALPIGSVERIPDMATYFASCLSVLRDHGITAKYVELLNEVDGYWAGITHLPPQWYAFLVGNTTAAFKRRGLLPMTHLVGPGNSQVVTNPLFPPSNFADYVDAMQVAWRPSQTSSAWTQLGAVSTHSYDWFVASLKDPSLGVGYVGETLSKFLDKASEVDHDHEKLRIVSEFSQENYIELNETGGRKIWEHNPFMGTCYPNTSSDNMFSDSQAYDAKFVASNVALVLLHASLGVDVAVFWELADKRTDNKCFGLYDRMDRPKPVLQAMAPLIRELPVGGTSSAVTSRGQWEDDTLVLGVVRNSTRTVLGLSNTGGDTQQLPIVLHGVPSGASIVRVHTASADFSLDSTHVFADLKLIIRLTVPAYSTATIVIEHNQFVPDIWFWSLVTLTIVGLAAEMILIRSITRAVNDPVHRCQDLSPRQHVPQRMTRSGHSNSMILSLVPAPVGSQVGQAVAGSFTKTTMPKSAMVPLLEAQFD